MENAPSLSGSRIVRLAVIGAGLAFAWLVLSVILGLTSNDARADEATDDSRGSGLLSGVTDLLDSTTSAVTSTVSSAVPAVTDAVTRVVSIATTPEPQQPAPAAQPQGVVAPIVGAVTAPVVDVVDSGVVSQVTAPVVATVDRVPIVADLVAGLGLDAAVTDTAEIVDRTASRALHVVAGVGTAVDGVLPVLPGAGMPTPAAPDTDAAASVISSSALARTTVEVVIDRLRAWTAPPESRGSSGPASSAAPSDGGPSTPDAVPSSAPVSSSAGPGGAGSAAWALVAAAPLVAHRAWVHRTGLANDDVPLAPALATDVSPD